MPQTPLPPGGPVITARDAAEQLPCAGEDFLSPHLSPRRQASSWHEPSWVGFAGDAVAPGRADATMISPAISPAACEPETSGADLPAVRDDVVTDPGTISLDPEDAWTDLPDLPPAAVLPAGVENAAARTRRAIAVIAGVTLQVRRRLGSRLGRLLRLAAVAASMGAVAVFAYQGGEHLAGLAGAVTQAAAPAGPAAAFAAPEGDRAATILPAAPPLARLAGPPNAPSTAPSTAPPTAPPTAPTERAAYYLDRARAGDPDAQYNVAVLYARGDGLVKDYASAAAWFRDAATAGIVAAQFNLAVIYERGLGIGQNMAEAVAWYERAAEQNYPPAQYNLGLVYAEGRGVARDMAAAARWYQQAGTQGLVPAMVNLAILYEKGEGVERSAPDAYAWYRAAARTGDRGAEQRARELFQQFVGAEKGRAVVAAAAVVNAIVATSAPRKGASPQGTPSGTPPGSPVAPPGTGGAGAAPKGGPDQPPG
jgi:TPR repeat protein